ncbi:MAG TPA: cobyrinic acid a,c-diamide synthase [Candidatus Nanopelagicales bacterium]
MSRRATLPGADELFRRTSDNPEPEVATAAAPAPAPAPAPTAVAAVLPVPAADLAGQAEPEAARAPRAPSRRRPRAGDRRPTGRERHEEKITVYVSPEELVDVEQAKLVLRAQHGLAVDRGRIVREAIAVVIADLEAKGEESILVRRLRGV